MEDRPNDIFLLLKKEIFEIKEEYIIYDGSSEIKPLLNYGTALKPHLTNAPVTDLNTQIKMYRKLVKRSASYINQKRKPGNSIYQCIYCSAKYTDSLQFHYHVKIHATNRRYTCLHCKKTFATYSYITNHSCTATAQNKSIKLGCTNCQKLFANRKTLSRHLKSGICKNSFRCVHCGVSFGSKATLKIHMIHHKGAISPFQCIRCQRQFSSLVNLRNHIRRHPTIKRYCCPHCSKSYASKVGYKNHLYAHSGEKPYVCSVCSKGFTNRTWLAVHMRTHTGEKRYKCDHCQQRFRQMSHLNNHMRRHTGERPYQCVQCKKAFSRMSYLQEHILIHTGEYPHICPYCPRRFGRHSKMVTHIRCHAFSNPFQCIHCQQLLPSLSEFNLHTRTHSQHILYPCTVCNSVYNDESALISHICDIVKAIYAYACSKCTSTFPNRYDLRDHEYSHEDNANHACPQCPLLFHTRAQRDFHKRIHAPLRLRFDGNERSYTCLYCDAKFNDKVTLNQHESLIHPEKKENPCPYCDKTLLSRRHLRTHIRIHTGERPYLCRFCNKTFTQSGHLQSHVRTHTGERPYKCTFCPKQFTQKGHLKGHLCLHTGERPYTCQFCDRGFCTSQDCKRHCARVHRHLITK